MLPWTLVDEGAIPGGGALRLWRRGEEVSIRLGADELMNSRRVGSEEALARLGCAGIAARPAPVVMIGGLGLGFTLRAAQAALPPGARIVVAELAPAVLRWARGPLRPLFGASLDDPRVSLWEGDVGALLRENTAAYDAVLLDVDNGPNGFSRADNSPLYGAAGLAAAKRALRPGGALAVWSQGPDAPFAARLARAGFRVEETVARSGGRRGARHVVWIATKPEPAAGSRAQPAR